MSLVPELHFQIESTMATFKQQEERIGQLNPRITTPLDEISKSPHPRYLSDHFKLHIARFKEIDISQFRTSIDHTIDILNLSSHLVRVEERRKGYQRDLETLAAQKLKKQERKLVSSLKILRGY